MTSSKTNPFHFKQFTIEQDRCPMKVGTDGVLLGAWADVTGVETILDIGTGTGLISIMLAQRTENANIEAVEIDEFAYGQAMDNANNCPWPERLEIFHDSIQNFSKTTPHAYDLIVSNPPFFSGGTFSENQDRASVRHTVKLPHGDLLNSARQLLAPNGKFCVILPYIEGLRFKELASRYHFYCVKMTEVKPQKDKPIERLLLQFERKEKPFKKDELLIQNEDRNNWTEAYIALTGDFYLNMRPVAF